MWINLWRDEGGAILSSELIVLSVLTVVGMISGMTALRDSVTMEFAETGASVVAIDPGYRYTGVAYRGPLSGSSATVNGAVYTSSIDRGTNADFRPASVLSAVEPSEAKTTSR